MSLSAFVSTKYLSALFEIKVGEPWFCTGIISSLVLFLLKSIGSLLPHKSAAANYSGDNINLSINFICRISF